MVVGLTGQSGSGKTTVSQVFQENGFQVINADRIAREVVEPGMPCLHEVAENFPGVLREDGSLNRAALAAIVFHDRVKLDLLGSLTYPYITERILERIECCAADGAELILLDAPTLFESRADDFCDLILSVIAPEELRLQRIMARDGLTEEQARSRLHSQYGDCFYTNNSDFIIKNNKSAEMLLAKAKEVSDKIKEYYIATKKTGR